MALPLRDHPLTSYRGLKNWQLTWMWRGGVENNKGDVEVLREVLRPGIKPHSGMFQLSRMKTRNTWVV
jgi:hypothetical protein